jgi:uncharacterized repeat protein (TIGR01451 family)
MNSRTRLFQLVCGLAVVATGAAASFAGTNQWTAVGPSGGSVTRIAYDPATPTNVYLVGSGGFYRSTDGGTTWTNVRSDFMNAPRDLAVDPSDASRVYVISTDAPFLYLSTDGGATLSVSSTFPTSGVTNAQEIAISQDGMTLYVATADAHIFRSTDRGQTWQARTPVLTGTLPGLARMAIDPANPATLYAAAGAGGTSGMFATHDGAATWSQVDPNQTLVALVRDIAINPAIAGQVWVASDSGIWVSGDQGIHWSNSHLSNPATAVTFDPSRNGVMYAGTYYGALWRSPDTGATWSNVTGDTNLGEVTTFAVSPAQSANVLVGGSGGIIGTTTSGASWALQVTGIVATRIMGLSTDAGAGRIYMNTELSGIHYLSEGAASTTAVNNGGLDQFGSPPSYTFSTAILAQSGQPGVPGPLLVSLSTGIARSVDGGSHWSLTALPGSASQQVNTFASSRGNPSVILASTYGGVFRSTDGGASFTAEDPAAAGLPPNACFTTSAAAQSDASVFYAAPQTSNGLTTQPSEHGLYRSIDAGKTWSPVSGLGSNSVVQVTVDPINAQTVYVSTDSAFLKSTDGGNSWSAVGSTIPLSMGIDPGNTRILFAVTGGASFGLRSVDGGKSWQGLPVGPQLPLWFPAQIVLDPGRPSTVLMGTLQSGAQELTVATDIALQVTPPTAAPLLAGSAAAYSFGVSNNGPYDATGIVLTIPLPAASTAGSASVSPSGSGACTSGGSSVRCTLDALRAGFSATVSLSVTPTNEGAFAISASIQGQQPDPDTSNNSVTTSTTVALPTDLSVTVSGASSAQVGDSLSYTFTVSNAGANPATSSQLIFQSAAGLTLTGAQTTTGGCTVDATSGKVTCALGDIAAGQSSSVSVSAKAASAGTLVSTATVSTTRVDTQSSNNTASASTTVSLPPPTSANDTGTVQAGQSVSISVLSNDTDSNGTLNSGSIKIVTQPTQGTVTVNSSGSKTYTASATASKSDSFTYTVDDTQGDRSAPATVTVTITAAAPAGTGGGSSAGSSGGGGGGGSLGLLELLALGALMCRAGGLAYSRRRLSVR